MKRTLCIVLACSLGLSLAASAQTVNHQYFGNSTVPFAVNSAEASVNFASTPDSVPSPVTGATVFEYTLVTPGHVRLNLYDSKENLIEVLVDAFQDAGRHTVIWNAADRESGAFLCTLNYGEALYTRKFTVLR